MTECTLEYIAEAHIIPTMEQYGYIHSVETVVPKYRVSQEKVLATISTIFSLNGSDRSRLSEVLINTGILNRYVSAPLDWYSEPQSWKSKNELYVSTSCRLLESAAVKALEKAKWSPNEVDHIITVSTTGISTPSLDARLMNELPFRSNVTRTPIFGLGCGGGLMGLARADSLARAFPDSKVLLLVVELCSLSFQKEKLDKKNLIASSLFADGAAAVTVSTDENDIRMDAFSERTWPDTLDIMGWDIEDDGFSVVFSKSIPRLVEEKLVPFVAEFFESQGVSFDQIQKFIPHPGGAKVLDALEKALKVKNGMTESREVLAEYGNMSAPTVLFALEKALSKPRSGKKEKWLLSSLGPGFTGSLGLLEV